MARSVGRLDWWNIKAEHTSYEWAAQIALYQVSPHGTRRDDLRAAYHTAYQIAISRQRQVPQDEFRELMTSLSSYLQCDQQETGEEDIDPAALALIREG